MSNQLRVHYATLQYYLREKLWRHAQTLASERFTAMNDYTFLLWKAFTLDMEGQVAEALREYKQCEGKRGVHAAALYGIQLIYRRNNDNDGAAALDKRLQEDERHPNHGATLQAAALLWHAGEVSKARDILNKLLDVDSEYRDEYSSVQLIRGWVDLSSGRGAFVDKCGQMFDRVMSAEKQDNPNWLDVDALMGKVAVLERKSQFWPAQELLNKCTVMHPQFTPAMLVKAKQLMRVDDWEQSGEITGRILTRDPMNVEALTLQAQALLIKEAKPTQASRSIADLIKALQHREPRNAHLYYQCAQCFSRLAGGNLTIITVTTSLAESAAQMQPLNTDVASEVAYQSFLRGDHRTAATLYKKASTAGDGNITPLLGLIKCTIVSGNLDDAEKQINFLTEIQTPQSRNAELLFLTAMLKWRKYRDQAGSLDKLDQAVEVHRQEYASQPTGMELMVKLNPQFMVEMAREYAQHCRTEPAANQRADPMTEKTRRLLDALLRHVPACTEAQLLNSRMAFVSGDTERASAMISACIRQDQSLADAYLLQAKIFLYIGNVAAASQALEQALSLDFDVNDSPQFNLVKGTLLVHKGEYQNALSIWTRAITLVDGDKALSGLSSGERGTAGTAKGTAAQGAQLSVQDHVTLYLQLAQTHLRLRNTMEAEQVIQVAMQAFRETAQSGRILIAKALLVSRSDVEKALGLLRSVPAASPHYLDAKGQMARMYLTQRGNRRAFAQCYEEVVEAMPTLQTYVHLGDAYTAIQDPEKAISAYEKARAIDPNNAELSVKIGRTLVTTHDYQRALRYYRDAVAAEGHRVNLRTDLACLYWRLGDFDKAIQTLRDAPVMRKPPAQDDVAMGLERVQLTLLQAKILTSAGDGKSAAEALIQARVYQNGVIAKVRGDSPDVLGKQRSAGAAICLELGDYYQNNRQPDKAVPFFNEALKHDEANTKAMLALARLHLSRRDLDGCEMQCNALLRVEPANDEATVMLADLMMRRGRTQEAAHHFLQLLTRKPDNYDALVHYMHVLRAAGYLKDGPTVIERAEKSLKPEQLKDPGFMLAKGLLARFTGDSRQALIYFNAGRHPKDGPYAQRCLVNMIEVYINPDATNLWEDVEMRSEVLENLRTAEKLLDEVADTNVRERLQNYIRIASKKKESVQQALESFFAAIPHDDDGAPKSSAEGGGETVVELVGMAIALQVLKQTPKARNHLKRIEPDMARVHEEDFVNGMLLLASIFIESGKYDLAQEKLRNAIAVHKGNSRIWEQMGLIYEKEQAYRDAAECYEKAWQYMGESDPAVGFKLAFNYLKAKRYVHAIDVCHKVLGVHPNYPRIKKEVLERARLMLNP